jgi:hypothetical protein
MCSHSFNVWYLGHRLVKWHSLFSFSMIHSALVDRDLIQKVRSYRQEEMFELYSTGCMAPVLNLTGGGGGQAVERELNKWKKKRTQRNKVGDRIKVRKREAMLQEEGVTRMGRRMVHFGEARQQQGSGRHRNLATSKAFELNLSW